MDNTLFKRSKRSAWEVRLYSVTLDKSEAYAAHIRCSKIKKHNKTESCYLWSWFIDDMDCEDNPRCYSCDCLVPDYIQALVRMYENE